MVQLDRSAKVNYTFFGACSSLEGIEPVNPNSVANFVDIPYRRLGKFFWQPRAISAVYRGKWDAVIFLGNPNFLSTWLAALAARAFGVPVLFWEHGWRRREAKLKSTLRLSFFRMADRLLVYAPRAKRLGVEAGYPESRIDVVWNSLDLTEANDFYSQIENGGLHSITPQELFQSPKRPLLLCTARITDKCRFDLLIKAAAELSKRNMPCNILLVGAGPAVESLRELASDLNQPVYFFGACYDERILSQLVYKADLSVSPGKVGLTAMHSMQYGTPVITHDNDDEQMPEVAAVIDGITGARFKHNDANHLADTIERWLLDHIDRNVTRIACRSEINAHWNPRVQAAIIEGAVMEVVRGE